MTIVERMKRSRVSRRSVLKGAGATAGALAVGSMFKGPVGSILNPPPVKASTFWRGADISWAQQMAANGYWWKNAAGDYPAPGTDANGNIDQWYFHLGTGAPDNSFISTGTIADNDSLDNGAASGQNADDAGTWSSNLPSVTPEPGSLTMVACALMAIGAVRRRSQRRSRT